MFGKKTAKKAQEDAEKKAAAQEVAVTQAAAPTPLQSAWEKSNLDFLDWESGKSGPVDVMKAPGLGTARSLFDYARAKQGGERAGIGALRLGLNASDPGLAANLATQADLRRDQDAAGQLENAVAARTAEAHGSVLPLSSLNTSRALNIAGLRTGIAQNAQGRADQLRQSSGFMNSPLFGALVQGGMAAATGGMSGLGGIGALRAGASRRAPAPVAPMSVTSGNPYYYA